jgi:hypothetical protein
MLNRGREDVESIDNAAEARRPEDTMAEDRGQVHL